MDGLISTYPVVPYLGVLGNDCVMSCICATRELWHTGKSSQEPSFQPRRDNKST